jgi:hypothetical protein
LILCDNKSAPLFEVFGIVYPFPEASIETLDLLAQQSDPLVLLLCMLVGEFSNQPGPLLQQLLATLEKLEVGGV